MSAKVSLWSCGSLSTSVWAGALVSSWSLRVTERDHGAFKPQNLRFWRRSSHTVLDSRTGYRRGNRETKDFEGSRALDGARKFSYHQGLPSCLLRVSARCSHRVKRPHHRLGSLGSFVGAEHDIVGLVVRPLAARTRASQSGLACFHFQIRRMWWSRNGPNSLAAIVAGTDDVSSSNDHPSRSHLGNGLSVASGTHSYRTYSLSGNAS